MRGVDEYTPTGTLVGNVMSIPGGGATGSALDSLGNLFVTDFSNNLVYKRDVFSGAVSVFANSTTFGLGHGLQSPESIAFSPDGSKMFVSNASKTIQGLGGVGGGIAVLDPVTGRGTNWYPLPSSHGSAATGQSDWLAVTATGTLLMTNESPAQGVMKVDQAATPVDVIQPSFISNVPYTPYALTVDGSGNLWLAASAAVLEYSASGSLLHQYGSTATGLFASAIDAGGSHLYIGDVDTGVLSVYNTADGSVASHFSVPTGGLPETGISGISVVPGPVTHSTSTAIACAPSTVAVGVATNCTATVTDTSSTGATSPTGSVTVTSNGTGTFSGGSCTLASTGASSATCSLTYTPSAVGSGTHTISAAYAGDPGHTASTGSTGVAVTTRPSTTAISCAPASLAVGAATTCTATVTDGGTGAAPAPTGTVAFTTSGAGTFAPGASCALSAVTGSSAGCALTYTPTALGSGAQTITGAYSGDPTFAASSGTFNLALNTPPTANAGGPYTGVEGAAIAIAGTAGDPDGDIVTTTWSVTPNGANDTQATCVLASAIALSTTVTCPNEGSFTLTLTATDAAGQSTTDTASLAVSNAAPTTGAITGLPTTPVAVSTAVHASVTFGDPGTLDAHTATWAWGDGSTSAGIITESAGSGVASGSHTYTADGVYTVSATITDADGASATAQFQYVVVFDPTAGFVTGGGWITSPTGAYATNPAATGKASFGFVSKYLKGANVPSGNTRFQFEAGSLDFKSTAYQWLVIAGQCRAQFKGTGTINGAGSYSFMLTGVDGERCGNPGPDTFRIQITDSTTGATVYDNGSDQAIGGGDIQVHSS